MIPADSPTVGRAVRLLFLAIGLIALCASLFQGYRTAQLLRTGDTAAGSVPAAGDPTASLAHPLVTFTTGAGEIIHYIQNGYTARSGRVHVQVLYQPSDPAGTAVVRSFSTLWLPIILPAILGWAALALVGTSFILTRRHS